MTIIRRLALTTSAVCALTACAAPTDGSHAAQPLITALPRALSGDEQVASAATTSFGLALFRAVNASSARDSNLALSPISASLALGMLMNGAEGETLDQVRRTLGFGDRQLAQVDTAYKALVPLLTALDPSVKMTFANAAWFDVTMPPSPAFTSRISDTFGARVSSLSFGAPSSITTINDWVSAATNARIPKIVSQFDAGTVAMLINATWFKGKWRAQFDPQKTHSAPFNVTASSTVPVSLMFNETGLVRTATLRNGTVVGELPYGGDAFVMDVLMPPVGQLESFVDSLTPAVWTSAIAALPDSARGMSVSLPKFRLETSRELKQDLAALGMPRAFGDAQLAPMFAAGGAGTSVSSVRQKVFVDVNEEGTEAAAVTSVTIVVTSIQQAFSVDRPFLFAIRERLTGTILFLGKVVRPVAP